MSSTPSRLGGGGEAWKWRQRLFEWEEDLVREFCFLLHDIVLQEDEPDSWKWQLDPVKGYSISGVYNLLIVADKQGLSFINSCR